MNFTCPHCGVPQIVTDKARGWLFDATSVGVFAEQKGPGTNKYLAVSGFAVGCANPNCSRVTVDVSLGTGYYDGGTMKLVKDSKFITRRLYPGSVGQPFPEHVPPALLEDYQEAWAIIDLSPKSSATLARRCLQAMIRDFCGIKKRTLFDEIDTLRKLALEDKLPKGVDPDTIDAMVALKDVGNIGAHMSEFDGVILDVDPGEAQKLLALIEMLFADWYVARGKRAERIAAVLQVAQAKKPQPVEGGA